MNEDVKEGTFTVYLFEWPKEWAHFFLLHPIFYYTYPTPFWISNFKSRRFTLISKHIFSFNKITSLGKKKTFNTLNNIHSLFVKFIYMCMGEAASTFLANYFGFACSSTITLFLTIINIEYRMKIFFFVLVLKC